jgi:diphthamide synthase subunit DPH2
LGEVCGRRVHRLDGEREWSAHRCGPGNFSPGGSTLYKPTEYTIIILIVHQSVAAILQSRCGDRFRNRRWRDRSKSTSHSRRAVG